MRGATLIGRMTQASTFTRPLPARDRSRPTPTLVTRTMQDDRDDDSGCYTPAAPAAIMNGQASALGYFALFTEIGLVLFVTTLGFALGGAWLDDQLHTKPLFIVLGFLVGAGLGAVADYRLITRFLKRLDTDG